MFFPQNMIASLVSLILPATWAGAVRILLYVVGSLGLYTMAHSRRIKGAWLSWIPVADMWVLGALSDQYQYVVKNRIRSRRVWLLILQGLIYALWAAAAVVLVSTARGAAGAAMSDDVFFRLGYALSTGGVVLGILALFAGVLGLWLLVLKLMALYDVYRSCDPGCAVLFLILSIAVPSAKPVLLFLNRDKEAGMPPRISEE